MVDGVASDIYSLGLCLLEACTMVPEQTYYLPDGNVNKSLIQEKVIKSNKSYQSSFVELIVRMLSIDPVKRIRM